MVVSPGVDLARNIESLKPGESYSYEVEGSLSPTALTNTTLTARAQVASGMEEETIQNNEATDTTLVLLPKENEKDKRTPDLNISVWNNVGDFVYPGDTVVSKITVANQSPYLARDVKVWGTLSNDHPMPALPLGWSLGDLKAGEVVEIEFSVGLIEELPGGEYHLSAEAKGKAENGDESTTGWYTSNFWVKVRYVLGSITPEVAAKGEVLSSDSGFKNSFLVDKKKYLPYILATSVFVLVLIPYLKRRLNKNESK
jgi:hypothetical protein